MRFTAPLLLVFLTACGDWPDVGGPALEQNAQSWPALLPLDQLVENGAVTVANDDEAETLAARAARLRARAAVLRGNANNLEALRARIVR